MSEIEKVKFADDVKKSSKFFSIYIRISVFGHVIYEKTIPAND